MAKWRPYLQRASELGEHQAVVAHYCRMHAVELMMQARKAGDTSPELEKQLLEELQRAEASKKSLKLTGGEGQATVESFALNVFDAADEADHAARDSSSQGQVFQKFYAAALFLDVCAQFYGELPPDLLEKARYARFRVVQIREGAQTGHAILSRGARRSGPCGRGAGRCGRCGDRCCGRCGGAGVRKRGAAQDGDGILSIGLWRCKYSSQVPA